MPYRPWCPKCGDTLYLDETQWPPTVRCRCGFNLVDANHMQGLVNSQRKEYEAQEGERREQSRLRIEEAQRAEREAARKEAARRKAEAEAKRKAEAERTRIQAEAERKRLEEKAEEKRKQEEAAKVLDLPQPTAAQRKQGYTTPVHCAECGEIVWRRKCEVGKRDHFFCSRAHQSAWRKRNPVGVIRKGARSTG